MWLTRPHCYVGKRVIKTVIFDLGRVIVPFDFQRGYARLEPLCGLSTAEIRSRISAGGLVPRFESGEMEPEDFVAQLSRQIGLNAGYEEFREIWMSIFLPETLIPEEMLIEIKRTHRLVLLSNTNRIHFDGIVANYPLLRHFDRFVLSYEVGAMKPSPLIYEKAIEAARCEAAECFFTDDIQEYVEGAKSMGIDAVQFQSAAQIREELSRRGVLTA
jgi:putative hydrolase of the HAD superfamily